MSFLCERGKERLEEESLADERVGDVRSGRQNGRPSEGAINYIMSKDVIIIMSGRAIYCHKYGRVRIYDVRFPVSPTR